MTDKKIASKGSAIPTDEEILLPLRSRFTVERGSPIWFAIEEAVKKSRAAGRAEGAEEQRKRDLEIVWQEANTFGPNDDPGFRRIHEAIRSQEVKSE